MKGKLVFHCLAVLFFFSNSAGRLYAQDEPEYGETPGYLAAMDKAGKSLGPCPLVHTEVKAEISGIIAHVTVRQNFRNPFEMPIEAVYTFPLSHDAAVDGMTMRAGNRTIRGIIKKREEAEAVYEQARNRGQLAALLDQERPNIFTQHLSNIMPGKNVDVVISYSANLRYSNGGYSFVYPMVVGPRYIPGEPVGKKGGGWAPDTTEVPDASRFTPPVVPPGARSGHDISIEVRIESGVPFTKLRSTQHELAILKRDKHSALVRLADRAVIPNRDFILSYDVAGDLLQDGLVAHKIAKEGYFMLILQPPAAVEPDQVIPKELVFVLDTSGSMRGLPIEKAKETMQAALDQLYPGDTFNLITFSGETRILFDRPVPATAANLESARQFLSSSYGSGGTEMMRAIRAALEPSDAAGHTRIVCFMTDGFVGNDMAIISEVQKHPNARVFAFGIGSSPNRFLLDKIAEEGRGAVEYVSLESDADAAASRFRERIRNPLLQDIALEWSGIPVGDVYPQRIPDLFSAEPVVLYGRYENGGRATVRLRGMTGKGSFQRDIQLSLPEALPQNEVLGRLWAGHRIGSLMSEDYSGMPGGNPRPEVRESITRLGLEYGLMTQFTSFVAIEEQVSNQGGKAVTVQVPVEMPEGVSYEGIFGSPDIVKTISWKGAGTAGGIPGVIGGLNRKMIQRPPVQIGGSILKAGLIKKVEPVYPELARKARISGMVILTVSIDGRGNVVDARLTRGHPLLADAAIAAVRQWKYSPAVLSGLPVPVTDTAVVEFKLGNLHNPARAESRIDTDVSRVLARINAGQPPGEEPFIRDGKAEIELSVENRSVEVMEKLLLSGFEVIGLPEGKEQVIGRIAPDKLELLLGIDAVLYIAPHYR